MRDVQHMSVYIARRPAEVSKFASDPRNLPRWAAGLSRPEVRKDGMNGSPTGVTIHNPMRVVPNGESSEFIFTLIRQPQAEVTTRSREVPPGNDDRATSETRRPAGGSG